jgi:uncharacterized protein (TIGR00369 family)
VRTSGRQELACPKSPVEIDAGGGAPKADAMTDAPEDMRQYLMAIQRATPFFQALGAEVVEAAPGRSVMRLPYAPHLVGNPDTGVIHGGAITALLDHACGMAVSSGVEVERPNAEYGMRGVATLDLRIDYLRAAEPGRDVIVVGECVRVTRQIVFARGRAHQGDPDKPVALATGAFIITQMRTG